MIIKHIVQTVDNGMQLIVFNKKRCYLTRLFFLDLNMPLKNGLECLKEIRNRKIFDCYLFYLRTEKDIHETFINGANVYLKKPNNFELLKKTVEQSNRYFLYK
jgi:DNA-binding response OmpR family regulator